jgi:hypothetical protein
MRMKRLVAVVGCAGMLEDARLLPWYKQRQPRRRNRSHDHDDTGYHDHPDSGYHDHNFRLPEYDSRSYDHDGPSRSKPVPYRRD